MNRFIFWALGESWGNEIREESHIFYPEDPRKFVSFSLHLNYQVIPDQLVLTLADNVTASFLHVCHYTSDPISLLLQLMKGHKINSN